MALFQTAERTLRIKKLATKWKKSSEDLNGYFTKENIQIVNNHIKKGTTT